MIFAGTCLPKETCRYCARKSVNAVPVLAPGDGDKTLLVVASSANIEQVLTLISKAMECLKFMHTNFCAHWFSPPVSLHNAVFYIQTKLGYDQKASAPKGRTTST